LNPKQSSSSLLINTNKRSCTDDSNTDTVLTMNTTIPSKFQKLDKAGAFISVNLLHYFE